MSNGTKNRGLTYRMLRKNSKLKEIYIVRYADDFKLITSNRRDTEEIFIASQIWMKERLGLPILKEKSKITNLRKEESEFLGFTIKAVPKFNKYVATTHISEKSLKRIKDNLTKQIKVIQRTPNSNKTAVEIYKYNSMVLGIHNYYRYATHCNPDLQDMSYQIMIIMKSRFRQAGFTKQGEYKGHDKGILGYTKSSMMRYIMRNKPLVPIGYIQHKNPMKKSSNQ